VANFCLVHGAFRGGWAWDPVVPLLDAAGHAVVRPDLTGMGEGPASRPPPDGLDTWVDDVVSAVESLPAGPVVLVGHSQGGVVIDAAAVASGRRVSHLVHLDAPVPRDGERAVDLGGAPPDPLPPRDGWIPPRPLDASSGLAPEVIAWANPRLCSTPVAPSLDPIAVSVGPDAPVSIHVFCSDTPPGYPAHHGRARLDADGLAYTVLEGPHDIGWAAPAVVAELIDRLVAGPR
jgi:pimeloyl-ACP methyl ester carboxylesterase